MCKQMQHNRQRRSYTIELAGARGVKGGSGGDGGYAGKSGMSEHLVRNALTTNDNKLVNLVAWAFS